MRFEFVGLISKPTCVAFAFRDSDGNKATVEPDWQKPEEFVVSSFTVGANITPEQREEMYEVALWAEENAENFVECDKHGNW